MLLDVSEAGEAELNWHARESCSLDVAERVSERGEPLSYYDLAILSGRRKVTLMEETASAIEHVRELIESGSDPHREDTCTL